jgi:transglutaminase-like putative cysteine protease
VYLTSTVVSEALKLPGPESVVELDLRLQAWFIDLFMREPSSGSFVFLLLLCLLLWLMAYFCAWAVFRWGKVWWAVILSTAALMMNMTYARANLTVYLLGFLLLALLLVVRASVAQYEQEWRMDRVGYGSELVGGFLRAGFALSLAAIFLAWVAPEALASRPIREVWDRVGKPWRQLKDESSRMFEDLNYQNEAPVIVLSRAMRFGGPVELSDAPIMDVQASQGRYWRYKIYHEYTSDGWNNTDMDSILVGANEQAFTFPPFMERREITQTITLRRPLGNLQTLTVAGQPLRADLPIHAVVSYVTQESAGGRERDAEIFPPGPGDPSLVFPRYVLEEGTEFKVVSSLSVADDETLRGSGTSYPSWVVPRYLQLPDSLPVRVRRLAEEVTAELDTPYDRAIAIRDYLRSIPYNEQIDGPAMGEDGVDYFLFHAREGYCSYYASAMVVMLRAVGIPARYVEGYSQGEKVDGAYHIVEWDGHSWPEVYFPDYGWVEFEPTGADPINDRSSSSRSAAGGATNDRSGRGARMPFDPEEGQPLDAEALAHLLEPAPVPLWQRIGLAGWLALSLAALFLVAFAILSIRRRRAIEGLTVAERVYSDLVQWAIRLLRIHPLGHQTPHEYAGTVAWAVPKGRHEIVQIADLYVQERFGGKMVAGEEVEVAWREAWPALWRRWVEKKTDWMRRAWKHLFPDEAELDLS